MRTLAHLSDLHFGTEDPAVVEALVADVGSVAPDVVVVSGDLTQRARRGQFAAARDFLARLPSRVLAVPGNHDVPLFDVGRRAVAPFSRFRRYVEPAEMPAWYDDEVAVLGLNTARPSSWKGGRVSWGQVRAARRWFRERGDRFKVLVSHHPFLPPHEVPHEALVARATEALAALSTCGVDLVLSGHLHVGYSGDAATHHHVLARGVLVAQAGTAVSRRTRGVPNAYNVVRVDGGEVEILVRRFENGAFRKDTRHTWVREADAWQAAWDAPVRATGRGRDPARGSAG